MTPPGGARRLLVPLTPVYRLGLALREFRLRRGWEPVHRLRFPVISIGNLSTGGAGKTPFAIALVKALTTQGFSVDVLSRGYGRQTKAAARVRADGAVDEFGDEPLLIARESGVPVYVARERYQAGLLAEAAATHRSIPLNSSPPTESVILSEGCAAPAAEASAAQDAERPQIHILDDAFQHRQLHRDIDILLLNRDDWRDRLLPAGNLRETHAAARRADVIAIPDSQPGFDDELRAWGWRGPIWRLHRHMDVPAIEGPVLAFCGIARPAQFFAGLEDRGLRLAASTVFRDHHRYTASDLGQLLQSARRRGAAALVTTEKDRVRLDSLSDSVSGVLPLLTVRLRVEINDESGAIGWLSRRLRVTELRPSL